jgi:lysozyme
MTYDLTKLAAELTRDEGKRNKPYKDTVGKLTIGIGRNLDDRGLSDGEISVLLSNDIIICEADLDKNMPWWRQMSDVRQRVLMNMCFNLGISKLLGFKNTLAAMREGRYTDAAKGMANSLWYKQVGDRAKRLCFMMEHNKVS